MTIPTHDELRKRFVPLLHEVNSPCGNPLGAYVRDKPRLSIHLTPEAHEDDIREFQVGSHTGAHWLFVELAPHEFPFEILCEFFSHGFASELTRVADGMLERKHNSAKAEGRAKRGAYKWRNEARNFTPEELREVAEELLHEWLIPLQQGEVIDMQREKDYWALAKTELPEEKFTYLIPLAEQYGVQRSGEVIEDNIRVVLFWHNTPKAQEFVNSMLEMDNA